MPRTFLEKYVATDVPTICHDELRLPLMAQSLGFRLYDTGLYRGWFDPEEMRFFNADTFGIAPDVIKAELAKPTGRRVFHPCRSVVDAGWVRQ